MPKQNQNNSILPFQGGLNTEANRFNYPPECTLDEQNFILTKDGKRERRLGIVLSDEDIDLAPEGILFEDKILQFKTSLQTKSLGFVFIEPLVI